VITHRLSITYAAQLDESIAALLAEACTDVGPLDWCRRDNSTFAEAHAWIPM
jgi:hypothetical protein